MAATVKYPNSGRVYHEIYTYSDVCDRRETELFIRLKREERKGAADSESKTKSFITEMESVSRDIELCHRTKPILDSLRSVRLEHGLFSRGYDPETSVENPTEKNTLLAYITKTITYLEERRDMDDHDKPRAVNEMKKATDAALNAVSESELNRELDKIMMYKSDLARHRENSARLAGFEAVLEIYHIVYKKLMA